jgi:hypothetical protein
MFYSLLGRVVWFVAKRYVRRKVNLPRPVLAGGVLALLLAVVLVGKHSHAS